MKTCSKCGEAKEVSEFSRRKRSKDGHYCQCKSCVSLKSKEYYQAKKSILNKKHRTNYQEKKEQILAQKKLYYRENKAELAKKHKAYREANKDKLSNLNRKYYEANKDQLLAANKKYYEENKARILEQVKAYSEENYERLAARKKERYKENREEILADIKHHYSSPCHNKDRVDQLPPTDKAKWDGECVTAECKLCKKRFWPTNGAISHRISAYEGKTAGEGNLYCSDECKNACPVFNFTTGRQVDSRSILAVDQSEREEARHCQTYILKEIQCDEFGYNFCERCGDIIDTELHHTLQIAAFGKDAINPAGHMLLCAGCHVELHNEC